MFANCAIFRTGALLVVVLAASSASAQSIKIGARGQIDARAIVAKIEVLPRQNQWQLVEPALRPVLEAATRLPRKERDRLIRSSSAIERGLGIFIADQQGDVAALLACADLLDDKELTFPYAAPTAGPGQYAAYEQTVGQYLTATYLEWFGVSVDGSPARFDRLFREDVDPQHLVRPWIVRLRRAKEDAPQTARLKERIEALPDDVRWAVVTSGYSDSLYTAEQAREILVNLSRPTQQAILSGAELLPDEPLFRMNGGAYRRVILEECQRLLNTASP